ncbi:MAG: hypothetical protein AABM64_02380 [Pseudomonadota bacterium]
MSKKVPRVRSVFVSDVHLGTRACQAERLLSFLRHYESEYLYLVGDIVDFWAMSRGIHGRSSRTRAVRDRGLDGVICGHIHSAAIKDIDGLIYINCGDWVDSCTAIVEHHDGRMELVHWIAEPPTRTPICRAKRSTLTRFPAGARK